ncbi:hypothetical protein CR513_55977, partial [Mucuna pruriens]
MSQMQSVGSRNLPSQTVPNLKGGIGAVILRSGRELPQQSAPQPNSRPANVESEPGADSRVQQPARSVSLPFPTRTVLERRSKTDEDLLKLFRRVEINIPLLDPIKQVPKYAKFLMELCIHKRKKLKGGVKTGEIVNLEPTGMVIQLANRSIVQPLGILEDVLVQVNEMIFQVGFYMLDMEDEVSRKGSALILGIPFLMTARTKIDVHVRTLSMEFEDNLV